MQRRFDEAREQRVRGQWLRLELGMELDPHEPRMIREFDHLGQCSIRAVAGDEC